MPASYPGQQWRHGWIPMTGGAEKSKNHGRTPGKNSAIKRAAADAGAVLNRMKAQDAAKSKGAAKPASKSDAKASAPKPSWPAGKKAAKPAGQAVDKPTPGDKADPAKPKMGWPKSGDKTEAKTAAKPAAKPAAKAPAAKPTVAKAAPKPGAKVGTDSHGKPLAVGDEVKLTGGRNQGKTGKIVGKGPSGQVKVDTGDGEVTEHGMNVRSSADHAAAKKTDGATRQAAPAKPAADGPSPAGASVPIPEIQDKIQAAYKKLVGSSPSEWVGLARIRAELGKALPRERVDEALTKLGRQEGVYIVPVSNRKGLSDEARAAAITIGGQEKHVIAFK